MLTDQMKRSFKVCLADYKIRVKNYDIKHSVIANHCWSNNHNLKISKNSVLQKCLSLYNLDFWEGYQTWENSNSFVNDLYSMPIWLQFL